VDRGLKKNRDLSDFHKVGRRVRRVA